MNSINCLSGQTVDSTMTEYKNDEEKPEMNNKDKEIQFVHEQQTHLIETSDNPISQEPEEDSGLLCQFSIFNKTISDHAPQTISTDSYSSERQESSIKDHFGSFPSCSSFFHYGKTYRKLRKPIYLD